MSHLAIKIAVIESESGWGSKIDDYMVCLSVEDAKDFAKEFNSKNTEAVTPSWYMKAEGSPLPIDLNDAQFVKLEAEKRVWLSQLKNL